MAKEYVRKSRLDPQLRRELTALVREDLTDPRIAGVTVTRVDVAPDLRQARVLVSVLGDDAALAEAVSALQHAAGRLRRGLGDRLRLRYVPQLHFRPDEQLREADRLNSLIRQARAADDQAASERDKS